ncbi:MAG: choice-of-anchor D domain-containing protein [Candidatus Kapabacteria bacterium]|jgi:WD40 repeat protein|nr:choice-of-anchor D domain-containing protein [Candidatus Kapabacteria bacterium]
MRISSFRSLGAMLLFLTLNILVNILCSSLAAAQSLGLFNIVDSAFPRMRANVVAYTAQGQQILSPQSFRLLDDNRQRAIVSYTCPVQQAQPVSAVLAIDVSLSMTSLLFPSRDSRLDAVQQAANIFVSGLASDGSEAAVTAFADDSYIAQDFTRNKDLLRTAINDLRLFFGTNYEAGFLGQPGGALRLFSRAKHANRALIFLTDGESSVSTQEVIREARRLGVVVYCISIGLPVPSSLDSIARASGGRSFSNIASLDAAVRLYQELSMLIRQNSPCVIEWISDAACRREERVLMLSSSALPPNITATARYMPPQAISEQIRVNPTTLPFGAVQTGSITQRTMSISLASGAQNRTVLRWISPDSTTLRVLTPTPLVLQAGATPLTVDISYRSPGSGYRFFTILAELDNGCTLPLYITTGAFGERPIIPTLELVRPNGGEVFLVGTRASIAWKGVPPSESVILDMSIDSGATWRNVDSNAVSLNLAWTVPNTPSDRCLMRVRQKNPNTAPLSNDSSIARLAVTGGGLFAAQFGGRSGGQIISAGAFTVALWDSSAQALQQFSTGNTEVIDADMHESGAFAYILRNFRTANVVYSRPTSPAQLSPTQRATFSFRDFGTSEPRSIRINPANPRELVITNADPLGQVVNVTRIVTDQTTGGDASQAVLLPQSQGSVQNAAFSSDGREILAAFDGSALAGGGIRLWRNQEPFQAPLQWQTPRGFRAWNVNATRLPDGSLRVAVVVQTSTGAGEVRFLRIERNAQGVEQLREDDAVKRIQSATQAQMVMSSFDRTGTYLVVALANGTAEVYEISTGAVVMILRHSAGRRVNMAYFNPSASRIVTAGDDGRMVVWILNETQPIQTDPSDSLWRIVRPRPEAVNITIGTVVVGALKDTLALALTNTSAFPVGIRRLWFASNNNTTASVITSTRGTFSLIAGNVPFTLPAAQMLQGRFVPGQHFLELRFRPNRTGEHLDSIVYETISGDTVKARITGVGTSTGLEVATRLIDWQTRVVGTPNDTTQAVLVNRGTQPLTIPLPSLVPSAVQGTNAVFTVLGFALGNRPFTISTAPVVLAVGDSLRVVVRFTPPRTERFQSALLFRLEAFNFSTTAQLFGVGAVRGAMLFPENISVPVAVQERGQCSPQITVRLLNTGTETLTIQGVDVLESSNGTPTGIFRELSRTSAIAPGSIGAITLLFAPQTAGLTSATLRIRSNSVQGDVNVVLQGRSERPELVVSMPNIIFPPLEQGISTTLSVRVRNQGNTDVAWINAPVRFPDRSGVERFQLTSTPQSARLAAEGAADLTLRFLGGTEGATYNDSLVITDTSRCFSQTLRWSASVNSLFRLRFSDVQPLQTCEQSAVREFTVQNIGTMRSVVEYAIVPPNPLIRLLGTQDTLNVGETLTIRVQVDSLPRGGLAPFSVEIRERRSTTQNSGQQGASQGVSATARTVFSVAIQIFKQDVGLDIVPRLLTMGDVEENTATQATITLRNRSSQALMLPRRALSSPNFSLEAPSVMIPPYDSLRARVIFSGAAANAVTNTAWNDAFVFVPMPIDGVGCAVQPDTLRVNVRVLPPRSATLVFSDISASPGDTVAMRVFLQNRVRIPVGTVLRDTLRYNVTLLQPLPPLPMNPPVLGERIVPVRLRVSSDNSAVPIDTLRFRAALGNDTLTTLRLSGTPQNRAAGMSITATGATFRLTGVARAGGLRLIVVTLGTITNLRVRPNPASGEAVLEFTSAIADSYTLTLLTPLGNRIDASIFAEQRFDAGTGVHSRTLDVSRLPVGTYFLHLRNSRELASYRLLVVR